MFTRALLEAAQVIESSAGVKGEVNDLEKKGGERW